MNTSAEDQVITAATLVDLLSWRASEQPHAPIYSFLVDSDMGQIELTYAELDRQARAVGTQLQQLGLTGQRALLLYPPGIDYVVAFFGCLYSGVVAVPAYPPNPARLDRALPRIQALTQDARPAAALTTEALLPLAERLGAQLPDFQALRWLATDVIESEQASLWQPPAIDQDSLAFLQYTSGSTATPKGVMLSHGNLLHNSAQIYRFFGHSPASRGVIWLPPYHDMGLIGGVLQPLYGGFPVTLMAPLAFLQRPMRWLETIARTRATTSGGPNFAYDLCVRTFNPEQHPTLDLSSWQVAFSGAEPVRAETLERFAATFAPFGFRREAFFPCYGLAEATLIVTGGAVSAGPTVRAFQGPALAQNRATLTNEHSSDGVRLVSCGRPGLEQQVVIAHPERGTSLVDGEIGEVWVAGPSVAHGYWNQPEQTAATFAADLVDRAAGPFLRTGDLGFLHNGELYVTGRIKDLIIIRGRNHYPQDIEQTAEASHPALRPGAGVAFAADAADEERLVIVYEIARQHRTASIEEIAAVVRAAVARQHEIQVYAVVLIKTGTIPKTSSGKLQRQATRALFLAQRLPVVGTSTLDRTTTADAPAVQLVVPPTRALLAQAPSAQQRALLEQYLHSLSAQILRVDPAAITLEQPLNTLGLDSLMAVELQHSVESGLGLDLPMVRLLQGASIAECANALLVQLAQTADPTVALRPGDRSQRTHPLSYNQRSLWFVHQLAPESSAYNISSALRLRTAVDIPALRQSFQLLVERHPLLRTTFGAVQGVPMQQVQAHAEIVFQAEDAAGWSYAVLEQRLSAEAERPFDLQHGPLLRVLLFTQSAREHVLLLTMHHIIADFWSLAVLLRELGTLYTAISAGQSATLPPLPLEYSDYARWQSELLDGPAAELLASYWQQQLGPDGARELPVLTLPTDRPRPPVQTYHGRTELFRLDQPLTTQLKALARREGATLYMTLLALFQVALHRYSGQDEILVGSPTAGRSQAQLAEIVGYFVNPIVLRASLADAPSFAMLLGQVRQTVLGALEHQAYPFSLLVERMQPDRDPSYAPLFQVLFTLEKSHLAEHAGTALLLTGQAGTRMTIGGLEVEPVALTQQAVQFDLALTMEEDDGGIAAALQYNVDLFDAATIKRLAAHIEVLATAAVARPDQSVATLPLLTEAEQQQLRDWNSQTLPVPATTLHGLIAAQATRTPTAIAIADLQTTLSYAELDARANQLARLLRTHGIGLPAQTEARVALCLPRTVDLAVALLAVLKAGGVYVPLDPTYPQERLQLMLRDAGAAVVLTTSALADRVPVTAKVPVLRLDTLTESLAALPATPLVDTTWPEQLAYLIYTSGSTGQPKGVAITHRNAVALLAWAETVFQAEDLAGVLAATSLSFDLSVFEFFAPLSVGGTVLVAENALALPDIARQHTVTLINTVPSAIAELLRLDALPATVRTVNLAGEPLPLALVQQLYGRPHVERVFNLYGPSEDTTYSTAAPLDRTLQSPPPIGRPLPNSQAYVLDARGQPVPLGVTGELCLGGLGVSRGYLGRPALTAERYRPDPWSAEPGARLYCTGDLVRQQPDGQLLFLGRRDHQIKLRGYRIELHEIAAVLEQHPAVREAAVIVRADGVGERRLVAYVVAEERVSSGQTQNPEPGATTDSSQFLVLGSDALRAFLQQHLPPYMVPGAIVVLPALPLTPNGKLDRAALPAPEQSRPGLAAAYVAPRTPTEQALAGIWADVLSLEQIGVDDNFFTLGGHSLLATQVAARVNELLQVDLPLRSFFEAPTIARLAATIEQIVQAAAVPQEQTMVAASRDSFRVKRSALTRKRSHES